jgi:hydroxymethylbilane synthase
MVLEPEEMLPAVGQGAIGIECRADDPVRLLLEAIDHAPTSMCVAAERAMLDALDGSCRTPIAGHARIEAGEMRLRGQVLRPDGSEAHETERRAPAAEWEQLGREVGQELRTRAGPGFFT